MSSAVTMKSKGSFGTRAAKDFHRNWPLYLMAVPVLIFYIILWSDGRDYYRI